VLLPASTIIDDGVTSAPGLDHRFISVVHAKGLLPATHHGGADVTHLQRSVIRRQWVDEVVESPRVDTGFARLAT